MCPSLLILRVKYVEGHSQPPLASKVAPMNVDLEDGALDMNPTTKIIASGAQFW
jgi:hypothetical protein